MAPADACTASSIRCAVQLVPAHLGCRLQQAAGDEHAGMMGRGADRLDVTAEAAPGILGGELGDDALRMFDQRYVSHG